MMKRIKNVIKQVKSLFVLSAGKTELHYILSQAQPTAPLADKAAWLETLIAWIRSGTTTQMLDVNVEKKSSNIQSARIRFILQLVERNPHWKILMAATIRSILQDTSGLQLFSETGLYQESGFFSEGIDRLLRKILPSPSKAHELSELFSRVFTDEADEKWVSAIPPEVALQIYQLIQFQAPKPVDTFLIIRKAMLDSLLILGSKVAALGSARDIRGRLPSLQVKELPFLRLNQTLNEMVLNDDLRLVIKCHGEIEACRKNLQDVFSHLEESGVSINIVYRLEGISSALQRIETILRLLSQELLKNENRITRFIAELIRENLANKNPLSLVHSNVHLLARKIVERAGASGEHYITRDRKEYRQMLWSAAGGGFLTVVTTLLKFVIIRMKLALFFEGLFFWINYSGSFLAMQFMGLTLATKQPSMTAPALAGKLKHITDPNQIHEFVDEVVKIVRSQFAAAVGNIGMVIPSAILFDFCFKFAFGHHVLNEEYAHHTVEAFHPFKTLTIPHAAITGVVLWLASVSGGWLENWVVFRQMPEAIAEHRRLNSVFGKERCLKFSKWFLHNVSGFGVNISLGFLLAFIPVFGHFFGLPLEAKHVTLSSGALTFAVCNLASGNLNGAAVGMACLGIVFIGLLNFGVSFALALTVAVRARQVNSRWVWHLMREVGRRFKKTPAKFFFPGPDKKQLVSKVSLG